MEVQEILSALEYNTGQFPRQAVEAAVTNREAITPEFLNVLEHTTQNIEEVLNDPDYMAHIYAMYLLAQFKEKSAFPLFVKLISQSTETIDILFGDIITEGLDRMLASVWDGQVKPLQSVIENPEVDEWVRSAVLDALVILVAHSMLPRDDVMDYFAVLFREKIEHLPENEIVLMQLIESSTFLYPEEVYGDIKSVLEKNITDPFFIDQDFVDDYLSRGKEEVLTELKTDTYHRRNFIEDTVAELENWAMFHPQPTPPRRFTPAFQPVTQTVVRTEPKIGRNEPCPCGSGLKYKRCCGKKSKS